MFQEAYRKAYDNKVPRRDVLLQLEEKYVFKSSQGRVGTVLRPVLGALVILLVMGVVATPVLAEEFPLVYQVVERYAPFLAEYILPQEYSCSSAGIKMQVEAIHIKDSTAEVLVSFTDENGFDYINGEVDLYDSYRITSYSGESNVGSSNFLEYDVIEDKAYFKLDMSSWDTFDKEKFRFQVVKLLTNCVEEERVLDLSKVNEISSFKSVALSGCGGTIESFQIQELVGRSEEEHWRKGVKVLCGNCDSTYADKLEITAMGYQDGILRIQNCRGDLTEADRHMNIMLVDEAGNKKYCDYSVDWQEKIAGEVLAFNEQWFWIGEDELAGMQAVAECFIIDGCVTGDWEVVFIIEE